MNARVLVASLALVLLMVGVPGCGGSGSSHPAGTYYFLSGTPNPATVFSSSDICFSYPNNLTNGAWHANSNLVVVGEYSQPGYWSHPANAGGHPASPNNGSGGYRRLVHMPLTEMVAYTTTADTDGIGPSPASDLVLATMDRYTGALGAGMPAQFSDGYTGSCNVLSSSADELLILENSTTIRRYLTANGSSMLTYQGLVTLSQALPATALCDGSAEGCYGGSFAWDGAYYYFARSEGQQFQLDYDVYQTNGAFVATYTAGGGGGMNSVYFDWSVGRYAIHDGYGNRAGVVLYASTSGSDSDTQCYGPVSPAHTFHP
jgi:hypothetical protein